MASAPWISNGGVGVAFRTSSCRGPNLDRAGGEPGILLPREPGRHNPLDPDDVLVAQLAGCRLELGTGVGLEDDLGQPVPVADVNERQAAEIAPGVHPAVQDHGAPHVVACQLAAMMCTFQHKKFGSRGPPMEGRAGGSLGW